MKVLAERGVVVENGARAIVDWQVVAAIVVVLVAVLVVVIVVAERVREERRGVSEAMAVICPRAGSSKGKQCLSRPRCPVLPPGVLLCRGGGFADGWANAAQEREGQGGLGI